MRTKITLTLSILLLSASVALAAGSKEEEAPENSAEMMYNEAVVLMEDGDCGKAIRKLKAALAENDEFAAAHNNLGYCLRKQGEDFYEKALEHYNRAIELDPKLAQAYHYRGVLHVLIGEDAAAKADHAALVDLDRELADELMAVVASGEEPEGRAGVAPAWN